MNHIEVNFTFESDMCHVRPGQAFVWNGEVWIVTNAHTGDSDTIPAVKLYDGSHANFDRFGEPLAFVDLHIVASLPGVQ